MSEVTAVLESSPEVPVMEVSRGPLVNLTSDERKEFRNTGILPKKEEAAPSSEPSESEAKPAGESETPKTQEKPAKPKQTAEERIAQLESTIEKIKKGAGLEKPKAATSEPAKPFIAPVSDRPKEDDYTTHAEYEEAVLDWKLEKRDAEKAVKTRMEADEKALNAKIEEGRTRYENLDSVIQPAANEIMQDKEIPDFVKRFIGSSQNIVDLLFTLGSNKEELASFMKLSKENPDDAIRYIALTDSLIAQELGEKKETSEVLETPVKPKTNAPKPPAEAGGRAATPPDSLQAALAGSGGKLNSQLKAEFMRQALAKMKT